MFKSLVKGFIAELAFLLAIASATAPSIGAAENIHYDARGFENDNFLVIITDGNNRDRTAYLTVFEVLAPDRRLRRLHQTKLLNGCNPLGFSLCGAGRFFVTIDEWKDAQITKNALVVYDLVRREHTAYRLNQIFSEKDYDALPETGFLTGVQWHYFQPHEKNYHPETLEFYLNAPIDYADSYSSDHPLVVIDLPTRTVRIEQRLIFGEKLPEFSNGWRVSMGKKDEDAQDRNDKPLMMLPHQLRYGIWKDIKVEIKAYVYRLNLDTQEYHLVPNDEWIENFPVGSCVETHGPSVRLLK